MAALVFSALLVVMPARAADPPVPETPRSPCPAGQFADPDSGSCYACRPGFWRNPALSPEMPGACYSPQRREERPARRFDRAGPRGCRGGQFEYRGNCYRCDIGFDRNPSFPPDRRGACEREYADREERAIRMGPIRGPTSPESPRAH